MKKTVAWLAILVFLLGIGAGCSTTPSGTSYEKAVKENRQFGGSDDFHPNQKF